MMGEARVNVCQAVIHGHDRYVRNIRNAREGKVLHFTTEGLEVDTGDKQPEFWNFEDCEEKIPEMTS